MGPWLHGVRADEDSSGDACFGPEAIENYNGIRLRWFDHWLKGMDTGLPEEPPVRIFVMGGGSGKYLRRARAQWPIDHGGRWRTESQWPLARARTTSFYLQSGGGLSTSQAPQARASATILEL